MEAVVEEELEAVVEEELEAIEKDISEEVEDPIPPINLELWLINPEIYPCHYNEEEVLFVLLTS